MPSETLSPTATFSSLDHARPPATGTSIVALSDSSVTSGSSARDLVARRDEDLDDRDVGEVADVGDLDLERAHSSTLRRSASTLDQVRA